MTTTTLLQSLQQKLRLRGLKTRDDTKKFRVSNKKEHTRFDQERPRIPDPRIFTDLQEREQPQQSRSEKGSNNAPFSLPTAGQCATHLALLECFSHLKRRVMLSQVLDKKFGILLEQEKEHQEICGHEYDESVGICAGEQPTSHQQRKWELFVELAVDRFETWWTDIAPSAAAKGQPGSEYPLKRTSKNVPWGRELPPLDVLMVWHAYMLNPHCFYEDCVRHETLVLFEHGLPWDKLNDAIDKERWIYSVPKSPPKSNVADLSSKYASDTLSRDLLETLESNANRHPVKSLICPICTTGKVLQTIQVSLTSYASADNSIVCPHCAGAVDREKLKVHKFKIDYENYRCGRKPIPATLLHASGHVVGQDITFQSTAPHYLDNLLEKAFPEIGSVLEHESIASIKGHLEKVVKTNSILQKEVLGEKKQMKLIDTLLSRYRENSSVFALNLKDAVIRQGSFVDKMNNILWIRAPNVEGTLNRARARFQKFFELIASHPNQLLVPTLDIDLVWHTQQLCPIGYYNYSMFVCYGRYIDHDDKISKRGLDEAFQETKRLWKENYPGDGDYELCLCWHCERKRDYQNVYPDFHQLERRVQKEVAYYRAVEQTRREHRAPPKKI